jgi:hypothetical protein
LRTKPIWKTSSKYRLIANWKEGGNLLFYYAIAAAIGVSAVICKILLICYFIDFLSK